MSKIKKFIVRIRKNINIWSMEQQIRAGEVLVDNLEREIKLNQEWDDSFKEILPHNSFEKKVQELKLNKTTLVETLKIQRKQVAKLKEELAA